MRASGDKISVVIPVFNRRHEVLRAIASVLRQERQADEILVVDDGSTDGSAAAVAGLNEPRIKLLRHDTNRGAAAARNTGIAAARGAWVAFLDSDDEWDASKLRLQLAALSYASSGAPAGVTGFVLEDSRIGVRQSVHPAARDATFDAIASGCFLGLGSTLLARRAVFDEVGLLDPELPRLEDWEWLMRYLPAHPLGVLPEALAIVHKGSDPSVGRVTAALARIRTKHRRLWYQHSWLAGRKFDSTLLVEEAAASYYARDLTRAALLSLRALSAYPFRGPGFVGLLLRRALRSRESRARDAQSRSQI